MNCEKHIKIHAPHCPICANEEREALLRVARVVKAWINLYNDGPLPNFASWQKAEKEIEAALKEVEHLLGVDK